MVFLVGCSDTTTTSTPTTTIDQTIYLEYPDETVELEVEVGQDVILPHAIKDDFIFNGWTDGDNIYAGLISVTDNLPLTLTPSYESIEDAFKDISIINGQVYLGQYLGDAKVIGIPEYWRDQLIVMADGFTKNIDLESIYLPNSLLRPPSLYFNESLKDFIYYGDQLGHHFIENMSAFSLEEYMNESEGCSWDGLESFDENNEQFFDEGCPVAYARRNDEEAVTIPGQGTYYTYAVVLDRSIQFRPNASLYIRFPDSVEYIVLPHNIEQYDTFVAFAFNEFDNLKIVESPTENIKYENGMLTQVVDGETQILFIKSDLNEIDINAEDYSFSVALGTSPNIEAINIIGESEDTFSLDGVLYQPYQFDDSLSMMMYFPKNYPNDTFVMPDHLIRINYVRNDTLENIVLNDRFVEISRLIMAFENLQSIDVDDDNPLYEVVDGILYSEDMHDILFIPPNVTEFTLPDGVVNINAIAFRYLETLHLNDDVGEEVASTLAALPNLKTLTVDSNNPHINMLDGALYTKDLTELLMIPKRSDMTVLNISEDVVEVHYGRLFPENLEWINVDEDNITYASVDGFLYNKRLTTLLMYPENYQATSYDMPMKVMQIRLLPEMITSIDISSQYNFEDYYDNMSVIFYHAQDLESITIEPLSPYYEADYEMIASMDRQEMFLSISEEASITIPNYISYVHYYAFYYADQVVNLFFESSETTIEKNVLELDNLKTITITGDTVLNVGVETDHTFYNYTGANLTYVFNDSLEVIYVDADMVEAYQNDPFWSIYSDIIQAK